MAAGTTAHQSEPAANRRPMRADARRNYDRLLTAARTLFTRDGVDASLEEVARMAGVGIGTLYRHFPTRDALLEALMSDRFESARTRADALMGEADSTAALTDWMREFLVHTGAFRGLPASITAVANDPSSDLYRSCHEMRDAAQRLLVRAQESGDVRADVSADDVFLMASAIGWLGEQALDDPTRPDRMLALMIDGLRTKESTATAPSTTT